MPQESLRFSSPSHPPKLRLKHWRSRGESIPLSVRLLMRQGLNNFSGLNWKQVRHSVKTEQSSAEQLFPKCVAKGSCVYRGGTVFAARCGTCSRVLASSC